ncbi:MAG: class I SAM-dependent methyltransferase [Lachnospiraceae bacterium]|nr:class I SAM-dependent methyltransferase [Lachnospiraceae bacterium]
MSNNSDSKYGKSLDDILSIKSSFISSNDELVKEREVQADILRSQKKRETCKICGSALPEKHLFLTRGIPYFECSKCGHVNSGFDDTEDFAAKLYIEQPYGSTYHEASRETYETRLKNIYIPKAEFMVETLKKEGLECADIHLLDDGAGSGYFVEAASRLGCDAKGIEVSSAQVRFGNEMSGKDSLKAVSGEEATRYVKDTECNVVSFIGVLEHITNLKDVIDAVRDNKNIKYVYCSVPMFSFSVIFEDVFRGCFNRQLGGGHTHLYTDSSLAYMADMMGFTKCASWKFGSDMMDLYRMLSVELEKNGNKGLNGVLHDKFLPLLNDMQLLVDKSEFASEIHMVLKRKDS